MTTNDALVLLVLAAGVFLAPPISARLGVPSAVGEIVYGAIIAALVPDLSRLPAFVTFVEHFGFLLVLFLAGLELDTHALFANGPGRLLRALPFAVAVPVGSMLIAALLGYAPVLGLIVGTISIGLTARVLADLSLLRTPIGQAAIVTGGLGEVITIVCLTILEEGTHGFSPLRLLSAGARLVLLFGAGFVVLALLRDLAWWRPSWFSRLLQENDPSELGLRSALALLSAFAAIAALLSVPDVLAAFVAGLALGVIFPVRETENTQSTAAPLRARLAAIGLGFFVPIAFITVGQHLDLHALTKPGPLALGAGILAASGLVRFLALPILRLQAGWEDATLIALVLSEPLTLKVTVAELSVSVHALPAATLTPAVAASTAGAIIFPTLFRLMLQRRDVRRAAAEPRNPTLAADGRAGG